MLERCAETSAIRSMNAGIVPMLRVFLVALDFLIDIFGFILFTIASLYFNRQ